MKRLAALFALALTSTACLRSTTVVTIKPDGSGTIVQENGLSPQAMGMMKSMAASQGAQTGGSPEIFGEAQARKTADSMGVRFVSGEPIKTAQFEGYRANFAFDDVRKIQMKLNEDPTGGALGSTGSSSTPPFGFTFERNAASSLLTITLPQDKLPGGGPLGAMGGKLPKSDAAGADAAQAAQMLSMMKVMMQGLFVDVSLNVDGRIVKTNAPHVEGNRLTLLQLDFDKLLADEAAFQRLQSASDLKSLDGIAGLKIVTEPKLTIEIAK
jgi:hypothetical protein